MTTAVSPRPCIKKKVSVEKASASYYGCNSKQPDAAPQRLLAPAPAADRRPHAASVLEAAWGSRVPVQSPGTFLQAQGYDTA